MLCAHNPINSKWKQWLWGRCGFVLCYLWARTQVHEMDICDCRTTNYRESKRMALKIVVFNILFFGMKREKCCRICLVLYWHKCMESMYKQRSVRIFSERQSGTMIPSRIRLKIWMRVAFTKNTIVIPRIRAATHYTRKSCRVLRKTKMTKTRHTTLANTKRTERFPFHHKQAIILLIETRWYS